MAAKPPSIAGRLLLATDLNPDSSAILVDALLPFANDAVSLGICHVRWAPERFLSHDRDETRAELDAAAGRRLDRWAATFLPGRACDLLVESSGTPTEGIGSAAHRWAADLVVVGASTETGLRQVLLDSVTDRVVREIPTNVLVARAAPTEGVVLAATDLTDSSAAAIQAAAAIARARGRPLTVLHVLAHATVHDGLSARAVAGRRTAALAWVEHALSRTGSRGAVELLDGAAAARILEHAQAVRPELLVVGSNGVPGLARILLGSVAERVTRDALCPVLVVRR